MSKPQPSRDECGTVLFTVLLIMQIVLLTGVAFLTLVQGEYIFATRHELAFRALAAAEAGVEDAIQRLRYPDVADHGITDWGDELDDDWKTAIAYQTPGIENQFTVVHHMVDASCDRTAGECDVALDAGGTPLYLVTSEGRAGLVSRTVQAVVSLAADRIFFSKELCSLGDLVLAYEGELLAYDSHDLGRPSGTPDGPENAQPVSLAAHGSLTVDWATVRGAAAAGQDVTLGPRAQILQTVHSGLDLNLLNRGRIAEDACSRWSPGCVGATVRGDVIIGQGARVSGQVRYGGAWTAVTDGWQVDGRAPVVPPPPLPALPPCAQPRLRLSDEPLSSAALRVHGRQVLEEGVHTFSQVEVDSDAVLAIRGQVRLHTRRLVIGERGRVELHDTPTRAAVLHVYSDCRHATEESPCGVVLQAGARLNEASGDPTRLLIVVVGRPPGQTPRPAIDMAHSVMFGAMYAPDGAIRIGEGATFWGALTAKAMTILRPKAFAYDLALHRLGSKPLVKDAKVVQWRRLAR